MPLTLKQLAYQAQIRTKPLRENFDDIENAVNNLQAQVDAISTAASGSELVEARDYHASIRARLRSESKIPGNCVITGLLVSTGAGMTVSVALGEAIVDGIACVRTGATSSATITAPATKRYDVVVINSDNSLSVVAGNDSEDPFLPTVSSSQRALGILRLTSSTVSITDILDARVQGAHTEGKYFWKIQDAVEYLRTVRQDVTLGVYDRKSGGGIIDIMPGSYYEYVLLQLDKNTTTVDDERVTLNYSPNANHYRISATYPCISIQGHGLPNVGHWIKYIRVSGGRFYGNEKAGAIPNINVAWGHVIHFESCFSDGNALSTLAYGKDIYCQQVLRFRATNCQFYDRGWRCFGDAGTTSTDPSAPVDMNYERTLGFDAPEADITNSIDTESELPIFAIVEFASAALPGWEKCDGSSVSDQGSPWRDRSTKPKIEVNYIRVF